MNTNDEHFMQIAIQHAAHGIANNQGGPFGAVVVKNNQVVGIGHNRVAPDNDPTAHAEVNAIEDAKQKGPAWVQVVRDLVSQDGGLANLFVGLGSRSLFFFLVIGLQFFLYDYVRNLFQVGSDHLSLVLDVFYAVRVGLVEMAGQTVAAP